MNQFLHQRTVIKQARAHTGIIVIWWILFAAIVSMPVLSVAGLFLTIMQLSVASFVFLGLAIGSLGLTLLTLFSARSCSKSFLCICQEGVYGVAGKASFLGTRPFEAGFDQITNVTRASLFWGNGNVKIKCGSPIYSFSLDKPDEVISLIESIMASQRAAQLIRQPAQDSNLHSSNLHSSRGYNA